MEKRTEVTKTISGVRGWQRDHQLLRTAAVDILIRDVNREAELFRAGRFSNAQTDMVGDPATDSREIARCFDRFNSADPAPRRVFRRNDDIRWNHNAGGLKARWIEDAIPDPASGPAQKAERESRGPDKRLRKALIKEYGRHVFLGAFR